MQNSKNQQEFYVGLAIYKGGFIIKSVLPSENKLDNSLTRLSTAAWMWLSWFLLILRDGGIVDVFPEIGGRNIKPVDHDDEQP